MTNKLPLTVTLSRSEASKARPHGQSSCSPCGARAAVALLPAWRRCTYEQLRGGDGAWAGTATLPQHGLSGDGELQALVPPNLKLSQLRDDESDGVAAARRLTGKRRRAIVQERELEPRHGRAVAEDRIPAMRLGVRS